MGKRIDVDGDHWQMPQGGIDAGEAPRVAALRELREEVGTDQVTILAEHSEWLRYDLPSALSQHVWGGRFRGQSQRWFAMRFTGIDKDIDLDAHQPEFSDWRWVEIGELNALAIPFKRHVYQRVISEFRHFAQPTSEHAAAGT